VALRGALPARPQSRRPRSRSTPFRANPAMPNLHACIAPARRRSRTPSLRLIASAWHFDGQS
jgi:hypothetical protein